MGLTDQNTLGRRHYPRRNMRKRVGVLSDGVYFTCDSGEVGEGGMSITSEYVLREGSELVVSFHIPHGDFVSLRAVIRSTQKKVGDNRVTHGLTFTKIAFSIKRQISDYVSGRATSSSKALQA